jgi:NAD-dependent dihydropyrimidine dehydrogenase PreA subunit
LAGQDSPDHDSLSDYVWSQLVATGTGGRVSHPGILGCETEKTESICLSRAVLPRNFFVAQEDQVTYVIAQPCVDLKDRACVDECPVDCIYEGKRMLYIHPDECVDCGACEPVCPVEAIYYEDDTPEQWKGFYDANVHFFDDLGSPGGAAKMGVIDADHELVAALPPQEHDE